MFILTLLCGVPKGFMKKGLHKTFCATKKCQNKNFSWFFLFVWTGREGLTEWRQTILCKVAVDKQHGYSISHYCIIEILAEYIISFVGVVIKPSVGLDTAINKIAAQPPKLFRSCSEVFSENSNIMIIMNYMFKVILSLSIRLDISSNSRLLFLIWCIY